MLNDFIIIQLIWSYFRVCCCRPQVVREKLLCHAIIGRAGGKELVKKIRVICEFVNPLLQFSKQSIHFSVSKVFTYLFLNSTDFLLESGERNC